VASGKHEELNYTTIIWELLSAYRDRHILTSKNMPIGGLTGIKGVLTKHFASLKKSTRETQTVLSKSWNLVL
jgi:hypothetical protein